MADWSKAFLPASWRGVPFRVDTETAEGGRRLAVHDIIGAEAPIVEDMGASARRWSVTAYVAGSTATLNGIALAGVLDLQGASVLILPWLGPVLARVERWHVDRTKDRNGYIGIDIDFVEAGGALSFGFVAAASAIGAAFSTGIATVAAAVLTATGLPSSPVVVAAAAVNAVAILEAMRGAVALPAEAADRIALAVTDLAEMAAVVPLDQAAFVTALGEAHRDLAREVDPSSAATIRAYAALDADCTAVCLAASAFVAASAAMVTVRGTYPARQDAAIARSELRDATASIRAEMAALGMDAADWLGGIIDTATTYLSRTAADRSPLVRVETGVSLPATLLAHKLYRDPARAGELVERNKVGTPAFMPTTIEAVAP